VLEQGLEGAPWTACLGDLPACALVHCGLPVRLPADHHAYAVGVTGPEPVQAGRGAVGQQAIAPPRRVDAQMAAVMLAGRTAMVRDRGPTAHRADWMPLDGGIASRAGARLKPRVAPRDGRGLDHVPVRHPAQGTRPIPWLGAHIGQGPRGQGRHAPIQELIEPPLEGGACPVRHLTFHVRAQDIRLIRAARGPGRKHHGAYEHPPVPLARSLDDTELLAEPGDLLLGPRRLEHLPHLITGHGLPRRSGPSSPLLPMPRRRMRSACRSSKVQRALIAVSPDPGFSGHIWGAARGMFSDSWFIQ
jgi:hypothetical protein